MGFSDKIKYFIVQIDYAFSKSFLNVQSKFSDVVIDFFHCLIKRIPHSTFEPILGKLEINLETFQTPESRRHDYSTSINLEEIPNSLHSIINRHKDKIVNHLGKDFLYEGPTIYETFNMDKIMSKYDVYSNIWHMDSHDGHKIIKIFVLLHDTNQEDGPLIYLSPSNTKKNWDKLRERWTYDKKFLDYNYKEEVNFIGKKGSYLMINTSISSHRASIPNTSRKILALTLYPSWRKKGNRSDYNH